MNSGLDNADHLAREDPQSIPNRTRLAVLERDLDQCRCCGTGGDNRLQLHHVQFRSQLGSHAPENLITLCSWCHRMLHDGFLSVVLELHEGVIHAFFDRLLLPPRTGF